MGTLTLVRSEPPTAAEAVRLSRLSHEAALLRLTGLRATHSDALEVFRTGVALGEALWAARRPPPVSAQRYAVDVLASGAVRLRCGLEVKVETTPQRAAEYLLRRLLGPEAVRMFAFNLAQELSRRGQWSLDQAELAEWTATED